VELRNPAAPVSPSRVVAVTAVASFATFAATAPPPPSPSALAAVFETAPAAAAPAILILAGAWWCEERSGVATSGRSKAGSTPFFFADCVRRSAESACSVVASTGGSIASFWPLFFADVNKFSAVFGLWTTFQYDLAGRCSVASSYSYTLDTVGLSVLPGASSDATASAVVCPVVQSDSATPRACADDIPGALGIGQSVSDC